MQLFDVLKRIQPCNMDEPYIFVSYSAKDQEQVWRDVLHFQELGYNIWLDEKNLDKTKDSWRDDALNAIRDMNCSLLVYYVSRHSLVSQPCFSELSCTIEEYTKAVHFGAVKFIAVDAEPIDDIVQFSREVYNEIRSRDLPKEEKTVRAITLNNCIEQFFNSNNEKVRVKAFTVPNRKMDYFEEIVAAFPDETRVLKQGEPSEPISVSEVAEEPKEKPLPALNESPSSAVGQSLEELAVSEANRILKESGLSHRFVPAARLTEKQLAGAEKIMGRKETSEQILYVMDTSLFSNGKSGMVLTAQRLYYNYVYNIPVTLDSLISVEDGKEKDHLLLTFSDGFQKDQFYNMYQPGAKALLQVYADANKKT